MQTLGVLLGFDLEAKMDDASTEDNKESAPKQNEKPPQSSDSKSKNENSEPEKPTNKEVENIIQSVSHCIYV